MSEEGRLGHSTYLIKHLKELGTGLVNGADDCPTSLSQRLHEGNDLEAGRTVQAAGRRRADVHYVRFAFFFFITLNLFTDQFKRHDNNKSMIKKSQNSQN